MTELLYFPIKQFSPRFGNNFYSFEILSYKIENSESCGCQHATYAIRIHRGRANWVVERRFKDFLAMYLIVSSSLPETLRTELPRIPPRTFFRVLSDNFLNSRQEQLSVFLDAFIQFLSRNGWMAENRSNGVLGFLKLDMVNILE